MAATGDQSQPIVTHRPPSLDDRSLMKNVSLLLARAVVSASVLLAASLGGRPAAMAQYPSAVPVATELQAGFESINADQSKQWLAALTAPQMNGRGTGQPGYSRAATFVAERLQAFGLQPKGDNGSYFQALPMTRRVPVIKDCRIQGSGFHVPGPGNLGFERYTDQGQVAGEAVLIVFGENSKKLPDDLILRDNIRHRRRLFDDSHLNRQLLPGRLNEGPPIRSRRERLLGHAQALEHLGRSKASDGP